MVKKDNSFFVSIGAEEEFVSRIYLLLPSTGQRI